MGEQAVSNWRPPRVASVGSHLWQRVEGYVDRTVAWLDTHNAGWERRIDLKLFEDARPRRSVLGQLYGSHWDAPQAVRLCWPFGLGDSEQPTVEAVWRAKLADRTTKRGEGDG